MVVSIKDAAERLACGPISAGSMARPGRFFDRHRRGSVLICKGERREAEGGSRP